MTSIVVEQFLGANRQLEPKLLPDGQGVDSVGQKPGRGDLRGWRAPLSVMSVPSGTQRQTIYRMGRNTPSDDQYWLSWTSVVHAVRGYDTDDTSERTYYTGDDYPKVTDNLALVAGSPAPNPTVSRPLGLPAPAAAPTVAPQPKGTDDPSTEEKTYVYLYTYVNDWGWEGAPSPASVVVDKPVDNVVVVSGFTQPPAGNYAINRIRVYRSQEGTGDTTVNYFFVGEISLGTASLIDLGNDLAEPLPSADWLPAPGVPRGGADDFTEANLTNLTSLWNGMLAGIVGNAVRFSEAYMPYVWPEAYDVMPPDATPVALGVFGQTLLVLTTARPSLVAGSSPDSMDQQPLPMAQGCIAPRSVVSMGTGVAWASNDGLCWYGADGSRILTAGVMTRSDWLAIRPETIIGQMYEGLYFGSYQPVEGGPRKGFLLSPAGGAGIFWLDDGFDAAHFDELQDQLYLLRANQILKWEGGTARQGASFTSKVYRQVKPTGFACAEVVSDTYPVRVDITVDGAAWFSKTAASREPFRLPPGRGMDWQVQVTVPDDAAGGVQGVVLAQSMTELAQL